MTKERKIILLCGLLLLAAGLVYRFQPGIGSLFITDDELTLKKKKLAKITQRIENRENYKTALSKARKTLEKFEKQLLRGNTPSLAAVDMQNIVKDIVYKAGVDISRLQVLKPGDPDPTGYAAIRIKFEIYTNIRQLKDVVYGIETSERILRIEEMDSRRTKTRPDPDHPVKIKTDLTVKGYMAV